MGQKEILKWITEKDWVTSNDIFLGLEIAKPSLNHSLLKLFNNGEIRRRRDITKKNGYLYKKHKKL